MVTPLTDAGATGARLISTSARLSGEKRAERLGELFRTMAAAAGEIAVLLGEVDRSQSYRDEGATSTQHWVAERFGVSATSARALTHLGEKAWDLPCLMGALCEGDVSFDKVRAVADVANPEIDRELCDQAKTCTVRELLDIARATAARQASAPPLSSSQSEHDRRYLRFNDSCRTMTAQLPAASYAEAKACLEARARDIGNTTSDGPDQTRWDQRLLDGFTDLVRSVAPGSSSGATSASPFFVVAHVPLMALVDDTGEASALTGELEHEGLIDIATVQKIACDATIAIAVDDDVGHTMYEGRARRFPTGAQRREVMRRDRHCRFPGCTNVTFADVHHIVPWKRGGLTDLDNVSLMCRHHHGVVHRNGWTMSGNANGELTFLGPTGRVMTSRPSPQWTRVTAGAS